MQINEPRERRLVVDEIDIALGFDANYAPHAAAVMAAVVRRAPGARFRFIVLYAGLDADMRAQVEASAPGGKVFWREVRDDDLPAFASRGHLNRSSLFRLGLEKLAPADCNRLLYLDSDLAVLDDVRKLLRVDMGAYALGAVVDAYVEPDEFAQRFGLEPGGSYFNSGVLLLDLDKIRTEKLFTKTIDFLMQHDASLPYGDQDALNCAFWRNWHPLDVVWNVQRFMAMPETARTLPADRRLNGRPPSIVHFMGADKPWLPNTWHPWAWTYWQALAWTPFTAQIARKHGVNAYQRARLWLRWMRRRPRAAAS